MNSILTLPPFRAVTINRAADIFSVAGALAVIILIMVLARYATRWYARRSGPALSGSYIRIVDRAVVGNGSSIVVACVDNRYILLGVSDKNIQFLCELENFDEKEEFSGKAELSFEKLLGGLLAQNKRKPFYADESSGELSGKTGISFEKLLEGLLGRDKRDSFHADKSNGENGDQS